MSRNRKKTKSVKKKLRKYPKLDFASVFENSGISIQELTLKMGMEPSQRGNVYNLIYEKENPTWLSIKRFCEAMDCEIEFWYLD